MQPLTTPFHLWVGGFSRVNQLTIFKWASIYNGITWPKRAQTKLNLEETIGGNSKVIIKHLIKVK